MSRMSLSRKSIAATLRATLRATLLVACWSSSAVLAGTAEFRRGDSNDDGAVDLSDAVCTLEYLFAQGGGGICARRDCLAARDTDDDGVIDLSDPIRLLNFLFLGAPAPPAPFAGGCGADPTPDALGCASSASCAAGGGPALEFDALDLFAIWSEAYTSVGEQHLVHSRIRLRGGRYPLPARGVLEDVGLVAGVENGPAFANLAPLDGGAWTVLPEEFYPYRYRQSFASASGVWSFVVQYRPAEAEEELVDCAELDGRTLDGRVVFWAELEPEDAAPLRIWLSCFDEGTWSAARGSSPRRITLENGAVLEIELAETYFFRGVAGETSNRRMPRAVVSLEGETRVVDEYAELVYAGRHHNSEQEYRILLDEPIGHVYGFDLIDCPPGVGQPNFCFVPAIGESIAYTLDAERRRTASFPVTDWRIGE